MPFQMQGVGLIRAAVGLGQFRLALFPPVLPLDYLAHTFTRDLVIPRKDRKGLASSPAS